MNLQHLEYFFAIADNKSVSKAAEKLHVSQPSLSRVIRSMEEEMGTKLFIRTAKGMELTKEGEALYGEGKRALDILNNARISINTRTRKHSDISIYSTMERSPLAAIKEFKRFNPDVAIGYHLMKYDYEQFTFPCERTRENTFCLVPETAVPPSGDEFEYARFQKAEAVLIVPSTHWLAERKEARLEELAGEHLILPAKNSLFRSWAEDMFRQSGFQPLVEPEEICEAPMERIDKLGMEIANIFYQHDVPLDLNTGIYNAEFRHGIMMKHNIVSLVFVNGRTKWREGTCRVKLTDPGTERYSYMIWSKQIPFSDTMDKFLRFIRNYYD